jgi:hypothetical protein
MQNSSVGSASDEIFSTYAQQAMKLFLRLFNNMRLDDHVKTVKILTLAEHTCKYVQLRLSV